MRDDDLTAAPPDAGGHLGSTTKPGDTLQTGDPREPKSPALNQDTQGPKAGSQSVPWLILLLVGVILLIAVMMGLRL